MTPSPVTVEECTTQVGPAVPTSRDFLEMFSHFFTGEIIDLLVRETNRYAAEVRAATSSPWETNATEIRAYLGFHILMGINCLPEIRDYWSRDQKLHYAPITSRIPRDRFEELSMYFHFVDNSTLPSRDEPQYHRLQKVLPVISAQRERFLSCYRPHTQNSVDEAMIPYKVKLYIVYTYMFMYI